MCGTGPGMTWRGQIQIHFNPVPLQRWHLTTLSPFFSKPLPSQFLHGCFFLGPFPLVMPFSRHRTYRPDQATQSGSLRADQGYSKNQVRTEMITRRALMSTAIAGLLAGQLARPALAQTAAPNDPVAILTAIYTRAAKG